jgi:hypothetical protein
MTRPAFDDTEITGMNSWEGESALRSTWPETPPFAGFPASNPTAVLASSKSLPSGLDATPRAAYRMPGPNGFGRSWVIQHPGVISSGRRYNQATDRQGFRIHRNSVWQRSFFPFIRARRSVLRSAPNGAARILRRRRGTERPASRARQRALSYTGASVRGAGALVASRRVSGVSVHEQLRIHWWMRTRAPNRLPTALAPPKLAPPKTASCSGEGPFSAVPERPMLPDRC